MPRDLPLVASLLFDTPLLIHRGKANTILTAIGPRILDGLAVSVSDIPRPEREARAGTGRAFRNGGYMADNGIAVLPVLGTLIRRGSWLDSESGLTSYSALSDAVTEIMYDPAVRGLMLEVDSPGGEANGCFDLARFIRSASEATGKPVWGHANEVAASAGYGILSSAAQIWATTTSELGSIGCLAAHVDVSEADKMAGVRWTYIFYGDEKADGNMHEPLSNRARDAVQADVDALGEMFVQLVSQHRGIDAAAIRATNARMYRGVEAVESGLADMSGTFDEALEAFAASVDELQTVSPQTSKSKLKVGLMPKLLSAAEIAAAAEVVRVQAEADAAAVTAAATEAARVQAEADAEAARVAAEANATDAERATTAERTRCEGLAAITAQADRLGVTFNVSEAISKGMSVADARSKVLDAAAAGDAAPISAIAVPKAKAETTKVLDEGAKVSAWKKAMKRR
ncbi:S49 family peptidase [Mesorhizobium sp. M6A.T.Cr.TU.016.01.1.1]|uniref:S49 family peptidase n=1 Tax=Mesorhizobium sp. M6A.T.Cr.TU.016.01.1.1 TaxID=2493677 RepID=UPI000F7610A4|nr:S49 family peptidase [Mesorhizobium sp. M6A.T.Cr.TU.016.01.1.1]AZO67687.1 S49 family peptidase [Mesorhizobium sp. M6A.T.Cr.TU.016.01.1.1]